MKQVLLVLSLSGLALCGSLSNEYLPANTGSFGSQTGGAINTYSPSSGFASSGNIFGASSIPSPQYGLPGTSGLKSQFGGQYSAPSQYSRPAAPAPVYGTPSQNFGASSFRSTPFSSGQTLPSSQYGSPFKSSGVSSFGRSSTLSGSQYKTPSSQYGAPSGFGQGIGAASAPAHYSSQIGQVRGISTQYGAPQQYQPSASFRAGPQFGGVSSQESLSAHGPATGYSGTVQGEDGAYFY